MPNKTQLTDACRRIRDEYLKDEWLCSRIRNPHPYDINCGLCDDFCRDVANLLGGETDDFYGAWLDQLDEKYEDTSHVVICLRVDGIMWYFDAECVEGTTNLEQIPVVKNQDKTRQEVVNCT